MKFDKFCFYVLLTLGTFCVDNSLGLENPMGEISLGTKNAYFTHVIKDVPDIYIPFLSMPVTSPLINTGDYKRVVSVFVWYDQKTLRPEYVPSQAFTATNIQLYAATPDRKQDMAYLSYHKDGDDFLLVQTGGWQGRIYLLTKREDGGGLANATDAKSALSSVIAKFTAIPTNAVMPEIDVQKHGEIYLLKAKYSKTANQVLARLDGLVSKDDIALSFDKYSLEESRAAWVPAPDEWFSSEKRKKQPK